MSYRKGLSKSAYKNKMRMFWTTKWRYQRTPEEWLDAIKLDAINTYLWEATRNRNLLNDAVDKLVLERKLLDKQGIRMKEMIASPDKENVLLAIQIMAGLKPKKFKIIKVNEEYE